jgi:hypothetical protein
MTDIEALQQSVKELTERVASVENKLNQEIKAKAEVRATLLRIAAKRSLKKRGNNDRKKSVRRR